MKQPYGDAEYRVLHVPGDDEKTLLTEFQRSLFPDDLIYPPDKGHWWIVLPPDWGPPCGFAGMDVIRNEGFFCRGGVMPSHRGHGLQRRLIQRREVKARELGLSRIYSTTYDNPHSANNLIAEGFRLYKPKRPFSCEGTCYWEKKLT